MNLGNFIKQPSESTDYDLDYTEWLASGDTVESADVVVLPDDDTLMVQRFVTESRIKVWISGGTNGVTYKLTVTATTADGRVKQDEFKVKIKDF